MASDVDRAQVGASIRAIIDRFVGREHETDDLARALDLLEQVETVLDGRPRSTFFAETPNGPIAWRAYIEQSPFGGGWNPIGMPMQIDDPGPDSGHFRLTASVTLGRPYEGGPGLVHGGYIAGLFDHVLGLAQGPAATGAATTSLTIRYLRPTPLGRELTFTAWYEQIHERTLLGRATCHAGPTLTAEADGVFRRIGLDELAARVSPEQL